MAFFMVLASATCHDKDQSIACRSAREVQIKRRFDDKRLKSTSPKVDYLMTSIAYTIGTLVTRPAEYRAMRDTFAKFGFTDADCEFVMIDNSGSSQTDAYRGLNQVLTAARGDYVILCHQDIRLVDDDRATLDARLADLTAKDPAWAVAGNAGADHRAHRFMRITDRYGDNQHIGPLPGRVVALDENFLVVRRSARIAFSSDLAGFHLYGADICLVAEILGYSAYVIDFHLIHLGEGRTGQAFIDSERQFRRKWARALRPRNIYTTVTFMHVSGRRAAVFGQRWLERLIRFRHRIARSIRKRLP